MYFTYKKFNWPENLKCFFSRNSRIYINIGIFKFLKKLKVGMLIKKIKF